LQRHALNWLEAAVFWSMTFHEVMFLLDSAAVNLRAGNTRELPPDRAPQPFPASQAVASLHCGVI
jgi:hypothetical protein